MRPIPRAMLPHSAALMQPTADAFAAEVLAPIATLTRVRVETLASETLTEEETRVTQTALLLYDLRNSCPRGTAFAPGQRVAFEGVTYRVQAVETLLENSRPHHTEVLLTT